MGRRWQVALAFAALLLAVAPALADGPRPRVVVCVVRETPVARAAAEDVARAIVPIAPVRMGAVGGGCALEENGERVLLAVDADDQRVVLSARSGAGRAWSPRTIERGGASGALFLEQVAVVAQSLANAAIEADAAPVASAATSVPPAAGDVAAAAAAMPPPVVAPPAAAAAPAPDVPPRQAAPAAGSRSRSTSPAPLGVAPPPSRLRIEAGYAAATVGAALPVASGVSVAAFWVPPQLRIGVAWAYFPGASVDAMGTAASISRHAATAYLGAAYRSGPFELGGAAGPLLDVWHRTTERTSAQATAPASYLGAGLALRADAGYALTPTFGLHGALSVEIAPGSPEFTTPAGALLEPGVVRGRLDAGLTATLP